MNKRHFTSQYIRDHLNDPKPYKPDPRQLSFDFTPDKKPVKPVILLDACAARTLTPAEKKQAHKEAREWGEKRGGAYTRSGSGV